MNQYTLTVYIDDPNVEPIKIEDCLTNNELDAIAIISEGGIFHELKNGIETWYPPHMIRKIEKRAI